MKTYVGSGDRGRTSLLSGERVEKSHGRVEAVGEVDELNSHLGALIAALPGSMACGQPKSSTIGRTSVRRRACMSPASLIPYQGQSCRPGSIAAGSADTSVSTSHRERMTSTCAAGGR